MCFVYLKSRPRVTNGWAEVKSSREARATDVGDTSHYHSHTRMEIPLSHNWLEPPMLIFDDMRNRVSPRPRALPVSKLANSDPLDNLTPRTVTTLYVSKKQTETHRRPLPWHRLWTARLWRLPPR